MSCSFLGINDIKMTIYKDRVLKGHNIKADKLGKFYITYRASDKV